MAYKVIILYQLYMPSYFLGTFTEYPFIIILLFWLFRFHDLPLSQFIHQAIALKVQFKLISVGVFFADLGLFYLFLHLNKNNASKGVILAVLIYFFLFLFSSL